MECQQRSIPACAGEPPGAEPAPPPRRVYPRVCGGTSASSPVFDYDAGLSPRVRGNPGQRSPKIPGIGSIPACAGEPRQMAPWSPPAGVYPRVCGGTDAGLQVGNLASGLSPRVRGNPARLNYQPDAVRSIPACAGEPITERVGG